MPYGFRLVVIQDQGKINTMFILGEYETTDGEYEPTLIKIRTEDWKPSDRNSERLATEAGVPGETMAMNGVTPATLTAPESDLKSEH